MLYINMSKFKSHDIPKDKRIMEATILLAWCAGGHGNMTHTPEAECESNCNLRSLLEKNRTCPLNDLLEVPIARVHMSVLYSSVTLP